MNPFERPQKLEKNANDNRAEGAAAAAAEASPEDTEFRKARAAELMPTLMDHERLVGEMEETRRKILRAEQIVAFAETILRAEPENPAVEAQKARSEADLAARNGRLTEQQEKLAAMDAEIAQKEEQIRARLHIAAS